MIVNFNRIDILFEFLKKKSQIWCQPSPIACSRSIQIRFEAKNGGFSLHFRKKLKKLHFETENKTKTELFLFGILLN